ncbi:hypothetical protein [Streptomyces sp. NRRL S-378]|uniref:hypothetical protein n=1 Tax=Streptomyces sp. NRRL S-378 TaxID=1463904 RepID=UPI000A7D42ED|nr:hypothetical protein [Streptomyces sp. NRRL S-378]
MSTTQCVIGMVLVLVALAALVATPLMVAHSRTTYDHGPSCFWCHPRLPRGRSRH